MSANNQNSLAMARGTLEQYKFELNKTRILVSNFVLTRKGPKKCPFGVYNILIYDIYMIYFMDYVSGYKLVRGLIVHGI